MLSALSNLEVLEGSVTAEVTLTFARPSRKVTVTNDSVTKSMTFRFSDSSAAATLRPTETFSAEVWMRKIILDVETAGDSVPYRVWVLG